MSHDGALDLRARVIDGTAIAARVRATVTQGCAELTLATGRQPGLATVLVGDDPASAVHVTSKRRLCTQVGMLDLHHHLPATSAQQDVAAVIEALGADDSVSGILLQPPLPAHLDSGSLLALVPPSKDVDGLTTASAGLLSQSRPGLRPCTPSGVMELLRHAGVDLDGAGAVVVGRSELVGRPMAQLLLQADATVTTCHSHTRDMARLTRQADVLVVAAGVPHLVRGDWVKPGAVVVDVGIHRTAEGLIGDVHTAEVAAHAAVVTPVPGGVGPMTIAMLLHNTLAAATAAARRRETTRPAMTFETPAVLRSALS